MSFLGFIVSSLALVIVLFVVIRTELVCRKYSPHIRRVFEESPIFQPPVVKPDPGAESISFRSKDGFLLKGSYWRCPNPNGVVLFCPEFAANRWSALEYCSFLRNRFDVFSFDFRNHGDSQRDPHYIARHWFTEYEFNDVRAALDQVLDLTSHPVGIFGISRGGTAAIALAGRDERVRAVVTDGAFPTHTTVRAYMRKWLLLYSNNRLIQRLPDFYFELVRNKVFSKLGPELGCNYPKVEPLLKRIAPRPILMIHGGRDSYIRPDIAKEFHRFARNPNELWIVKGARHNHCLNTAGDEYVNRVTDFFQKHLA